MYRVGKEEVERIEKILLSGKFFRYGEGGECEKFEKDWAAYLGTKYARVNTNGTAALYAGLIGLGIGPGDSVIVPSCTYMATPLAVVAAGAIPIVADVDEALTLCPIDTERRIGPHTKAILPVHMVGLPCDMAPLMDLAQRKNLLVLEDACQAVGGGYEGRKLGVIGDAGSFSFNYYKNMTSGEGGAFVTDDEDVFHRGSVAVDCCAFYWSSGKEKEQESFSGLNFRANEIQGAMLNVQLTRIDEMLSLMRRNRAELMEAGKSAGLTSIKYNSPEYDCGSTLGFRFDTEAEAKAFKDTFNEKVGGAFRIVDTGRHNYTEWDPIMRKQGAHHPALDPFKMPANKDIQVEYTMDMCERSLDIARRSVLIAMHPDHTEEKLEAMAEAIEEAGG